MTNGNDSKQPYCIICRWLWHNMILSILYTANFHITRSCLSYKHFILPYQEHSCLTYRLYWQPNICISHTNYFDITRSCMSTNRLLWHNQILSVLLCHLCLQYHCQLYIHIHHCPGIYLLQEYFTKLVHHSVLHPTHESVHHT